MDNEISAAVDVLRCVASMNPMGRRQTACEVRKLLEVLCDHDRHDGLYPTLLELREKTNAVIYGIELIANAAGNRTFEKVPSVLADVVECWHRMYPLVPKDIEPERAILADIFREGLEGTYVEVGAWRPQEQSNTWQFYQQGHRGLLIEPIPGAWEALLTERTGDFLSNLAATAPGQDWVPIWANGPTSSCRPDKNPEETCLITRPAATLATILSKYPGFKRDDIDLCTIDVEGWEDKVFAGVNWDTFRPRVLMVECLEDDTNWRQTLDDHGYKEVAKTEKNLILRAST